MKKCLKAIFFLVVLVLCAFGFVSSVYAEDTITRKPKLPEYEGFITKKDKPTEYQPFIDRHLEPETKVQILRIAADGGTVVDYHYMNSVIKTLKAKGLYKNSSTNYCKFLADANFGVKKNAATGAVSKLYDISGNNNDAVQTTGANQPVWTANQQNGKVGLVYTAVTSYMTVGTETSFDFERTSAFSVYSVLKIPLGGGGYLTSKLESGGNYTGWELTFNDDPYIYLINTLTTNQMFARIDNTGYEDNATRSFLMTYAGTSAYSGIIFYVNGSVVAHTTNTGTLTASILNDKSVYIGARDASPGFNGTILFNAIFDATLTTAQRQAVESLINTYYAIY